ncbi:hypothetical protein ACSBR2_039868 [Camellia fascicularis]
MEKVKSGVGYLYLHQKTIILVSHVSKFALINFHLSLLLPSKTLEFVGNDSLSYSRS